MRFNIRSSIAINHALKREIIILSDSILKTGIYVYESDKHVLFRSLVAYSKYQNIAQS